MELVKTAATECGNGPVRKAIRSPTVGLMSAERGAVEPTQMDQMFRTRAFEELRLDSDGYRQMMKNGRQTLLAELADRW